MTADEGRVQAPHTLDECEVRCLACGVPMDTCPLEGPFCCGDCRHGLPTPPCHDLTAPARVPSP